MLSASEIGTFAFCPEAWYLRRRGVTQSREGLRRLEEGVAAHRRIGERTGRLHTAGRLGRIVLLLICAIVVALAVQLVSAGALLRP